MDTLDELHPYFIGAYAENADVLESLIVEFLRDHVYWRRNFHPENTPPVPTSAAYRADYIEVLSTLKRELFQLSADLKRSVPFFSPRYVGHMASDLLLPGVIAKIVTTLYNPNNVSEEASPATLAKELEVGMQLAKMVGYETEPGAPGRAWGHLTSGGTVANYQGLRNICALGFYPLALAHAARELGLDGVTLDDGRALTEVDDWALVNLRLSEIVSLRERALARACEVFDRASALAFMERVESGRLEKMGLIDFFARHDSLRSPCLMVPSTAHYSWEKSLKLLGWGAAGLIEIPVDANMRMDCAALEESLERCLEQKRPVLAVIGVLGNTEFGSIDPIDRIIDARDRFAARGLGFAVHVDAAWGGYLATMFRDEDGEMVPRNVLKKHFHYFPSQSVYDAVEALAEAESITIDPHKLGYIPYAAGAYIARERGMIDFIGQAAAYVFDVEESARMDRDERLSRHLGQYIIEGSKPGASVAAAYVTHRVLPLHEGGFGKILRHTIKSCEYFFDALSGFAERVSDVAHIAMPMEPDTNLVCLAINPVGNGALSELNRFGRAVFASLSVDVQRPIQQRDFIASYTSLLAGRVTRAHAARLLAKLGIDDAEIQGFSSGAASSDHIYVLRHTLMNPWLMFAEDGVNYIDRYLDVLERLIREQCASRL